MKWLLFFIPILVLAFDATSTSFFVRHKLQSISGSSTSTSFKLLNAGGQTADGTSTSTTFKDWSGILKILFQLPKPNYEQIHYHWRNDDGSESAATSATSGIEDTSLNITKLSPKRLRLEISNEGGTRLAYSTQQFRLEYGLLSTTCAAIGTWTDVGAVGGDWDMFNSTNLTDGNNTTNITVSTGGVTDANNSFLVSNGGVKDTSSQTAAVSVSSANFIEMEYSIQALAAATDGGTYCFRATNAGSNTNFTYTTYGRTVISAGITLTIDTASLALPALTPGVAVSTTTKATVTTSNVTGFTLSLKRDDADTTLDLTTDATINIADKTAWSAPAATSTAGNAVVYSGTGLGLRVKQSGTNASNYASAWWGTDDTSANALYAGGPSTSQKIVDRNSASSPGTDAIVEYKLDVANTQKDGNYDGSVTYTALDNP